MKIPGRDVTPDMKYNSKLLAKLTNYIMVDGKKSAARRTVSSALGLVDGRSDSPPLETFGEAVLNCAPRLEVRTRRVGGANYQVPYEVPAERQVALALRWIVVAARERGDQPDHPPLDPLAEPPLKVLRRGHPRLDRQF